MATGKVSVGGAIRYAWSLWSAHWRALWGVLALSALAATVWVAGDLARNPAISLAAAPALLVTTLMVYGALFRVALADRHADDPAFRAGQHGLQWGAMEWRMLGSTLLVGLFIGLLGLILLLGMGAVLLGVLASRGVTPTPGMTPEQLLELMGPSGRTSIVLATAVLLAFVTYLGVRLALALPATADQKAVRVLRTWKLTRGHAWPLFASALFIQLPVLIVSAWISRNLTAGAGLPTEAGPTALLIAALVIGAPMGLFVTPMLAGIYAYFYRALAPAEPPKARP